MAQSLSTPVGGRLVLWAVVAVVTAAYCLGLPALAGAAEPTTAAPYSECPSFSSLPQEWTVPNTSASDPFFDWINKSNYTDVDPADTTWLQAHMNYAALETVCKKVSYYGWQTRNLLTQVNTALGLVRNDLIASIEPRGSLQAQNVMLVDSSGSPVAISGSGGDFSPVVAAVTSQEETLMFLAGLLVAGLLSYPIWKAIEV